MKTLSNRKSSEPTDPDRRDDQDEEPLTDEELFQRALEGMDSSQIYSAKYQGSPAAELPPKPSVLPPSVGDDGGKTGNDRGSEEVDREAVRAVQEAAFFEQMIGDVEPIAGRDKYRRRPARASAPTAETPRRLKTPPLATEGEGLHDVGELNSAQRDLLRRADGAGNLPELHLRGDQVFEALARLEEFIDEERRRGRLFLRVIHGRGIRSELFPVLKPAVIRWLEDHGSDHGVCGYVPQRQPSGDYGALIIELDQ